MHSERSIVHMMVRRFIQVNVLAFEDGADDVHQDVSDEDEEDSV